jgi:2-isopropylmalate synthase
MWALGTGEPVHNGLKLMLNILDSTLREGEQTPGVCFPPHAKLAIAKALDELGVDIIEAGHPAVSPRIEDAVSTLAKSGLQAKVAAHARSVQSDVDTALLCGARFLGIFYCVSNDRLGGVFRTSLNQAIDRITHCIQYARQASPDLVIRYTPEDTVRSRFENVVESAAAAVAAGANVISIADTTGAMLPRGNSMYDYVNRLRDALDARGARPLLAVHCHNDRGLAVANALDAFDAGIDIIDATIGGLGERAGLVDMATLLTVLTADYGQNRWQLKTLPSLYATVATYSGIPTSPTAPIVGAHAFTHCAGVHTHAATQNAVHYQSLDPALVGRRMTVSLDHMSGSSSVQYALDAIGVETTDPELNSEVLAHVRRVGEAGRTVRDSELRDIVNWVQA